MFRFLHSYDDEGFDNGLSLPKGIILGAVLGLVLDALFFTINYLIQ